MFPKPSPELFPNTYAYESRPMVKPTGFREYDARWLFEQGDQPDGRAGAGARPRRAAGANSASRREIVVGHDFRSYSASIKYALIAGLMAAGVKVLDIGLAITPMAYFAQFALDVPAVAMVTASHNDNGWTGVKMGAARPVTFGPEEMGAAARHRHRRRVPLRRGRRLSLRRRLSRALHRRPHEPAETHAQAEGRRRLRQRHRGRLRARTARQPSAARSSRSTAISTSPSRATIRTPKTCTCCMRWRRR